MTELRTPRILAFAGSTRKASFNRKLIRVAADIVREAGGEVTLVELGDYPMPLYDGDLEAAEGLPDGARRLRKLMHEHDGLLLACPEYNSSITSLLKNTLDWCSRKQPDEQPLYAYANKVAAICSASAGALGGLRGLVTVRQVLTALQVLVLPEQIAVSDASNVLTDDGRLTDERRVTALQKMAARLVSVASALQQ